MVRVCYQGTFVTTVRPLPWYVRTQGTSVTMAHTLTWYGCYHITTVTSVIFPLSPDLTPHRTAADRGGMRCWTQEGKQTQKQKYSHPTA